MDYEKFLTQIKNNQLENFEYDFVIAQLCVLNNKPFDEMKRVVDDLISTSRINLKKESTATENVVKQNGKTPANEIIAEPENEMVNQAYKMLKMDPRKRNKKFTTCRVEGKIQGTKGGFAFLLPFNKTLPDIFIEARNLKGAFNNDVVSVEVNNINTRRPEGKVVQILERGTSKIVGKITINRGNAIVTPDDVKFGKDIIIPIAKCLNAHTGEKVVVQIERYFNDKKSPEGKVVEVLGMPNEIETEVLAIIRSYDLYDTFPKKVQDYAATLPTKINLEDASSRLDLRGEKIFTIDGEDTRDIDDAISISKTKNGNYLLGVHIADVGEYVKLNNIIDKEAFKRGTSVYFPNLVLPMLPRELSNGLCSLNEGEDRLALSVMMEINGKGETVNYKIAESVIKSKQRFTYTIVKAILDGSQYECEKYKSFVKDLKLMNELSQILIKMRDRRGSINFDIPEVAISLDDLGDVVNIEPKERNESHMLIESFMIAANETIAKHFNDKKIPFVYRIHETPDAEKIANFFRLANGFGVKTKANPENVTPMDLQQIMTEIKDKDSNYVLNKLCLRSLKKAKYSECCLGHFGLASTFYCHFTSPIRRYPDLTIHRIIKETLRGNMNGKTLTDTKHFVVSSAMNSSEREVVADKVERDVDDLYKVFYMQHHIGEVFEGKISSVTNFGIFVELINTVEGLVKLQDLPADAYEFDEKDFELKGKHGKFSIGMPIKVKAVRADIISKEIDFVIVNN